MSDTNNEVVAGALTLYFLVFIFQCIALTHSDTDIFYAACGHTLRDLMMSSLCISTIGIAFVAVLSGCVACCSARAAEWIAIGCFFLYVLIQVFMSGFILNEGVKALGNSNCTAVMQSTDGGINSISANLGSPLLAIMGIVSSTLTYISIFVLCVVLCIVGSLSAVLLYLQGHF
jgi:hypothetical protein